jgi:hypothetical protein
MLLPMPAPSTEIARPATCAWTSLIVGTLIENVL